MRLFLSCQQALQKHHVPAYGFWETYFKGGIEEGHHEWVEASDVDWAEGLALLNPEGLQKWRDRTWSRVVDCIKQQHQIKPIDVFLAYLFPNQVEPSAIREIQALGIPCVNFFCDNVREFRRIPDVFHCFDLHWVPEFKALKLYKRAKLNYIYAPMPVWVPPAQRTWQHPERYGVSFIGSKDIQREQLLARALERGVQLEIRGAGWQPSVKPRRESGYRHQSLWQTVANQRRFIETQGLVAWTRKLNAKSLPKANPAIFNSVVKPQPSHTEYTDIIQQSQITLGINRYPSYRYPVETPDTYSRMRDIEAPMMGACYLTEWTEGLEHLYELGEEIETYRSPEELVEKIQTLGKDVEKRKTMRHKAQQRALTQNSIASTLNKISTSLGQ